MNVRAVAFVLVSSLPCMAIARPFTLGVGAGNTQAEADRNGEAEGALHIFGRIGLTRRLSAQLDIAKTETDSVITEMRSVTALAVVDLATQSRLVPVVLAGLGLARAEFFEASHAEAGVGLEYRATGGFVVGGDLRLGARTLTTMVEATATSYVSPIRNGEYRSARVFAGVRF